MTPQDYMRDRYDWSRDRCKRFWTKGAKFLSGKGRDTLLHPTTIGETIALAERDCPQAADTIRVLMWQHTLHAMNTMQVVGDMIESKEPD